MHDDNFQHMPPPPPPPPPPVPHPSSPSEEVEVRYVGASSSAGASNSTRSGNHRPWSLRSPSTKRPSPTSVVLADLDRFHDADDEDNSKKQTTKRNDDPSHDDDRFDGNGKDDADGANAKRGSSCQSRRPPSFSWSWWAASVVVIGLAIAGLAGVLGYHLSGAAAASGSNNGNGDNTANDVSSGQANALANEGGGDDFPGAQLDAFPGAASGATTGTATATATTATATATAAAPTDAPTVLPTALPPSASPTSSLRPRLVAALGVLMTNTGTTTDNDSFDPATPRGRAVDWLLDYLTKTNTEWMLDLQRMQTNTNPAGNDDIDNNGQAAQPYEVYLPLPDELRQRYAMGVLYFEGGPRLGFGGGGGDGDGDGDGDARQPDHDYCTNWRGITCTTPTSNLVSEIDWEGVGYDGTLPPEIGLLSSTLRRLGMGTNRLRGTLPPELGQLARLEYLNLAGNQLRGAIPPQLLGSGMGALETLQLHSNRLTGSVPAGGLGSMTSLKFLDLSANQLSGALPVALGSMPALEWLCASSNRFTGPIPASIGNLDRLEWFDLTDNALSGTLPSEMRDCPIKWLELGRNKLVGPIPAWLGSMDTLQTIQVDDNLLTGEVPDELTRLGGLSRLKVTGNPGVMPWTALPCCFPSLEVSDLDVAREVGDGNPATDVDGRLPVLQQAGVPSELFGGGSTGSAPTYRPGHLTRVKNGILLSEGLDVEVVAYSDKPVRLADGTETTAVFHSRPDAGHAFASPTGDGSWAYVSNSEAISDGGVGALYFDAQHRVTGYKRILSGTERNCGGGATPWGTWISCEEPWRRYRFRTGQVFEVDPWGDEGNGRRTVLGAEGGQYESFAYDVRNRSDPSFFYTEDHEEGPVRRFRPNPDQINWEDPTNMLHGDGTIDYLVLLNNGSFYWSTNKSDGADTASRYFPNTEGIDCKDGHVYFVTKLNKMMYHLDLDAGTWTRSTTQRGKFDGEPDQIARILGDTNEILYMTEEEDGSMPGIHGRDRNGNSFTVLESPLYVEESTGVAFSPDGKSLLVAYQKNGILLRAWREDGKSFSGAVIDIKYHTYG